MAISSPIHTNERSIDRVLSTGAPMLLVFWRRNCPPCDELTAPLARLAALYAGRALIARIDAEENPGLVRQYGINHLPGLVFVKGGTAVAQANGAAPEEQLRAWLEYLIAGGMRPPLPTGASIPLDRTPASAPAQQDAPPPANGTRPQTVGDATFDRVIAGDLPVLVDFWAPWCGPCRAVAPAVERLAGEFAGRALVAKLNVDENPRTAQRFGITGIPALFIFKRGQVVERLAGAQPYPILRQALARHAAPPGSTGAM